MKAPTVTRTRFAQLELRVLREDEHLPLEARELGPLMVRWGLAAQPQECIWIVAYDAALSVRSVVEVARGGHASADFDLTGTVNTAANACGLCFEDHLILTPKGLSWSFVDAGYLKPAPYMPTGRNVAAAHSASPHAPRPV